MNFRQMEYFLAVVEEGGIVGAAKKLYVSASSVSQIIHKIETELGVILFNRTTHGLTLTYAGKRYLETVRKILQQHRSFINEIADINNNNTSGELAISLSEKRAKDILPRILPIFMKRYPHVRIKLLDKRLPVEIRAKQLQEGQYDLVISNHQIPSKEIENIPFCKEQFSLIVSKSSNSIQRLFPDGVIREKIPAEKLKDEELILLQSMYHGRILHDQIFQDLGIKPKVVMEVTNVETAKQLAISGIGSAICNEILVHDQPSKTEHEDYYVFLIDHPYAKRNIFISYNKSDYLCSFRKTFIEIAIEQFK